MLFRGTYVCIILSLPVFFSRNFVLADQDNLHWVKTPASINFRMFFFCHWSSCCVYSICQAIFRITLWYVGIQCLIISVASISLILVTKRSFQVYNNQATLSHCLSISARSPIRLGYSFVQTIILIPAVTSFLLYVWGCWSVGNPRVLNPNSAFFSGIPFIIKTPTSLCHSWWANVFCSPPDVSLSRHLMVFFFLGSSWFSWFTHPCLFCSCFIVPDVPTMAGNVVANCLFCTNFGYNILLDNTSAFVLIWIFLLIFHWLPVLSSHTTSLVTFLALFIVRYLPPPLQPSFAVFTSSPGWLSTSPRARLLKNVSLFLKTPPRQFWSHTHQSPHPFCLQLPSRLHPKLHLQSHVVLLLDSGAFLH